MEGPQKQKQKCEQRSESCCDGNQFSSIVTGVYLSFLENVCGKRPRGLVGLRDNKANGGILLEIRLKESSSGR